jgi:hypothetical protein
LSYAPSLVINRYYFNGTIAKFINNTFESYIRAPLSLAQDWKRVNFTDGSYVIYYETQARKVFYPAPLVPGIASTYAIATQILSIEDGPTKSRIVYRNGTVIMRNNADGTIVVEVPPTSLFPDYEVKFFGTNNCG